MKQIIPILTFLFSIHAVYSQKATLWGIVKDGKTGETLIGATVAVKGTQLGVTSNTYGFYSLSLKPGEYIILSSFIGYADSTIMINLKDKKRIDIELQPESFEVSEVTVTAPHNRARDVGMGIQLINIHNVSQMPVLMGEKDVMHSIQSLPGILTANEGTTSLSVRGGSFDQNLILLDDAPVYNPSHALSFFSVFNTDALKDVKVYTGAFPAEYGGRLSSIVDLHMKEGNMQNFSGNAGIGLMSGNMSLEGPIMKGKSSFLVSGRYCYAGAIANLLGNFIDNLKGSKIHFNDFNAKINHTINDKNHIYLSFYSGKDHFYCKAVDLANSMTWGNNTATLRWNHIYNARLFSNIMYIFSDYNYSSLFLNDARRYLWSAGLNQNGIKADYNYYPVVNQKVQFGFSADYHTFNPGKVEARDTSFKIKRFSLAQKHNMQYALYASDEYTLNERLSFYLGLRYSGMANLGKTVEYKYSPDMESVTDTMNYGQNEIINFYNFLEPRFSMRYLFSENSSLKLSYSRNAQYFHLISNSSVGLPTDLWLPADNYIKPQYSNIYSLGIFSNSVNSMYEFSTEVYYKQMFHIIDFKDNAELILNENIDQQIISGYGRAYGAEFSIKKTSGKLTGWINYTISKNEKQIKGINNGNFFHTRYDKLHNLNITAFYELNKKWSFSGNFKLTSGGYITMPIGTYNYYGVSVNYYSEKNGYQLPLYHHLDISAVYHNPKNYNRKIKSEWIFSIYNVYNKKNIFTLFAGHEEGNYNNTQVQYMYLFGIVPSITYSLKF